MERGGPPGWGILLQIPFPSRTPEYNNKLPSPHPPSCCVLDSFWTSPLTPLAMAHKVPLLTGLSSTRSCSMLIPGHRC